MPGPSDAVSHRYGKPSVCSQLVAHVSSEQTAVLDVCCQLFPVTLNPHMFSQMNLLCVIVMQEVSRHAASQVLATVLVALLQAWQLCLQLCSVPQRMCAASLSGPNWSAMLPLQKRSGSCAAISTPVLYAAWQQLISWCHVALKLICMCARCGIAGLTYTAFTLVCQNL